MPIGWRNLSAHLFGGPIENILRGMATLAMGSVVAKAISLAAMPILTRLYTPADFGVLSVFTAVVSILVPVLSLTYLVALPIPRSERLAINMFALACSINILMSAIVLVLIWSVGPTILTIVSMESMIPYWWVVFIGVVCASYSQIIRMWATRRRAYRALSKVEVVQTLSGSIVKLILGVLAVQPLGLVIGGIVSQSGGIVTLTRVFYQDLKICLPYVTMRRMLSCASVFRGFPYFRLPSQLLLVISSKALIMFVAVVFDAEITGQVGLALMAVAFPMIILGDAISRPYYAEIAKLGRGAAHQVRIMTIAIIKRMLLLGAAPAIILMVSGPEIFAVVFGSQWILAGQVASILSIYIVCAFISAPITSALNIFGKQHIFLQLNIQRAVLMGSVFMLAFYLEWELLTVVLWYAIVMSLHHIFTTFRVLGCIGEGKRTIAEVQGAQP
ncbi:MAG: hypothetical protein EA406_13110 [Rhodospirillales bacterium]|nr:MAG: hypothetical protein EA406_13110 [Rhodospirillales bacterium]